MKLVRFLLGSEELPVYRTVTDQEDEVLKALLGGGFRFELVDGEPVDELLFDVLARISIVPDFYFAPPDGARVVGTFSLRDGATAAPALDAWPWERLPEDTLIH